MMEPLSHLSHALKGSQILHFSNAVKNLQQKGNHIYNFTVGDFDPAIFPIPTALKKEIIKAYTEDYTAYPMAEGNLDLRQAIAAFERTRNNLQYDAEEVLVGSGGRPLIYAAFRAIVDKGEGVIYGVPSWNTNYYTQLVEGNAIEIATKAENGFLPSAAAIQPYLTNAVLLCLCSPQNPTGTVYQEMELESICRLVVEENKRRSATEKKLYVLFDSIYGALTLEGISAQSPLNLCPEIRPYVITINAVSKIFAATGIRVGWCLGPSLVLQKMKNILSHMGAWAPMAEQKAVARFLPLSEEVEMYFTSFKEELSFRLNKIYLKIEELQLVGYPISAINPSGGLYLSIKIDLIGREIEGRHFSTSDDIASYLLERAGIALLPFSVFGSATHLPWFRLSVGTCHRESLLPMVKRLTDALEFFRLHPYQSVFMSTQNEIKVNH